MRLWEAFTFVLVGGLGGEDWGSGDGATETAAGRDKSSVLVIVYTDA